MKAAHQRGKSQTPMVKFPTTARLSAFGVGDLASGTFLN
jgi:hypothetical protein